jgi:hypothetical protein
VPFAPDKVTRIPVGSGTLDFGNAKIKVPAETQTGQVFRLRNKGIRPVRGSAIGELYCPEPGHRRGASSSAMPTTMRTSDNGKCPK